MHAYANLRLWKKKILTKTAGVRKEKQAELEKKSRLKYLVGISTFNSLEPKQKVKQGIIYSYLLLEERIIISRGKLAVLWLLRGENISSRLYQYIMPVLNDSWPRLPKIMKSSLINTLWNCSTNF